jgi:hypothetical protein
MIGSGASGTGTGLKLLLIGLGRGYGLKHQKEKRSMNHFACRRRGGASGDPRPSSLLKKRQSMQSAEASSRERRGRLKPRAAEIETAP